MNNGKDFGPCFPPTSPRQGARLTTITGFSMASSGCCALGLPGGTYLSAMGPDARWPAAQAASWMPRQGLQQREGLAVSAPAWDTDHDSSQRERMLQRAFRSEPLSSAEPGGAAGQSPETIPSVGYAVREASGELSGIVADCCDNLMALVCKQTLV